MQSHAHTATDHAARYMTQLAKHWSHKFETQLDANHARIALPMGVCRMEAYPDALEVTIKAADAATLARMETVVADHLSRFAFREPDLKWAWTGEEL